MNEFIDIYCEREGAGMWAEPLNALTNIAFFIAAFFAFQLMRRENAVSKETGLLLALLLAIGTGSTLFHTLATGWAMMADTMPILLFQIVFLTVYAGRVIKLGHSFISALLLLFFLSIAGFAQLPQDWLNGSLSYAPAFLFLGGLGVYHFMSKKAEHYALLLAAGIFAVSLTFRSLDMALCDVWPLGVHFLWHCLNSCVLYLSLRAFILNYKR